MVLRFIRTPIFPMRIMNNIKTFVFLDLETTGLPSLENNKTKITELSLVAVKTEHLSLGTFPRVVNKLCLCFNPRKLISFESEKITGLSNEILDHLAPFSSDTVQNINLFLEHNEKPLCLVAHNGDKFDYPILQAEIQKTGVNLIEDILCIDSLKTFCELHEEEPVPKSNEIPQPTNDLECVALELQDGFDELLCTAIDKYESGKDTTDMIEKGLMKSLQAQRINETTPKKHRRPLNEDTSGSAYLTEIPKRKLIKCEEDLKADNHKRIKKMAFKTRLNFRVSFNLTEVYKRLTKNKEAINAHSADGDVQMLLMCASTLGGKFVAWANENARKFSDIPPMVPGKKI